MSLWIVKARTAWALGIPNLIRVLSYRFGVKLGINPVRRLKGVAPSGSFFCKLPQLSMPEGFSPVAPVSDWQDSARLFSYWRVSLGDTPPDWLANPLTGQRVPNPDRPWWQIDDFDPVVGDIKLIWELSRMDWVLAFAQRARKGDPTALPKLNKWLSDWCQHNPPYKGPNWKCGQECSIRVMHLAGAALVLNQGSHIALKSLSDLIVLHLQRIEPTVQYAMAQDNNHGTSEAAALFIGGSWLVSLATKSGDERLVRLGTRWSDKGRSLLESRAARLIGAQGTFSQYSLNYHRVMIDTFCIVECWRRSLALPGLSKQWCARALLAARWMHALIDPNTGDGPNVGANDGARLLQLTKTAYRDYRPSVQLSMVLFASQCAYSNHGSWNDAVYWFNMVLPVEKAPLPASLQADDGGFLIMRRGVAMAQLRYPRFKFRPSQADALHLDLWMSGVAYLRDAGTYSYNTEPNWLTYFGGVAGHNSIQFDAKEQMPRLSRFLLGGWLKTKSLTSLAETDHGLVAGAAYSIAAGAHHQRDIKLSDSALHVCDKVNGFEHSAVLRWRLAPGNWDLLVVNEAEAQGKQYRVVNENGHVLRLSANVPIVRCELVLGWESLHYLEKTPVPVVELEVGQSGIMISEYEWLA